MNCEEKLAELFKIYQRVTLLSDKNGCRVFRIRHKTLGKDLVLHVNQTHNDIYETLCGIRHKNIPEVYEVFNLEDGTIVLEEYINGMTISEVTEVGKYRKCGTIKVLKQICDGLAVLHENGIVHRDIKPENIMIDKSGRVIIIDFNAARRISLKSEDTVIMGTVGYAAPEQLGLAASDAKTDIFALGILMNVMLIGVHPNQQIAKGICGKIIRKCANINVNERYQTAIQLKKALNMLF